MGFCEKNLRFGEKNIKKPLYFTKTTLYNNLISCICEAVSTYKRLNIKEVFRWNSGKFYY